MTPPRMYEFHKTFEFAHSRPAAVRPNGQPVLVSGTAVPTAPSTTTRAGYGQVWRGMGWIDWTYDHLTLEQSASGEGGVWYWIEDHRQKQDEKGRIIEGTGTPYWLPEDTYQSAAHYITELGPLPEGHSLTRPEKPLVVAQEEKMREIAAAHERALSGAVALNDPTPSTVAIEAGLLAASDSEGLEWVRDQLATRRVGLETAVYAAVNLADVESIAVSYAV